MRILCSLGNYSPTVLSAVSPGHHPRSPKQPAPFPGEPQGTWPDLRCLKSKVVMKMSCNCIRREDCQRCPGLWQAAPLHTLAQRLPVPKQVRSPGLTAAVERPFQILALAGGKLFLISNLSVPMAQPVIIHSCASIVLRLKFNVKPLC